MMKKISQRILALTVAILAGLFLFFEGAGRTHSTVYAAETSGQYVFDYGNILSDMAEEVLQSKSEELAAAYGVGIYILTIDDYTDYEPAVDSIYEWSKSVYNELGLGLGNGRDGMLLTLSMADRDYSLIVYGETAQTAFTDKGQAKLEEAFLDDFKNNEWKSGMTDYQALSERFLQMAKDGKPFDSGILPGEETKALGQSAVWGGAGGILASLLSVFGMKSKMKNTGLQNQADRYVSAEGVQLTIQDDVYTHTTETRRSVKSSGTSRDSSGFSGRSGKF